ncbi:MAG: PspC domain-containing protein [Propionibacteriaceae bacterium]|nr:PspC domain-containing protein [Propionibacteriaceae bacterium]
MAIKKFTRNSTNKMLAGVCGGIAAYFNWDATWTRFGAILVCLVTGGLGVAVYLACWLIVPDDRSGDIGMDSVFDFYSSHRNRPDSSDGSPVA